VLLQFAEEVDRNRHRLTGTPLGTGTRQIAGYDLRPGRTQDLPDTGNLPTASATCDEQDQVNRGRGKERGGLDRQALG